MSKEIKEKINLLKSENKRRGCFDDVNDYRLEKVANEINGFYEKIGIRNKPNHYLEVFYGEYERNMALILHWKGFDEPLSTEFILKDVKSWADLFTPLIWFVDKNQRKEINQNSLVNLWKVQDIVEKAFGNWVKNQGVTKKVNNLKI